MLLLAPWFVLSRLFAANELNKFLFCFDDRHYSVGYCVQLDICEGVRLRRYEKRDAFDR
jgi:hypothetical protein